MQRGITPLRLIHLRRRLRQTQARMAFLLGVGLSHYRNYERGRRPIPPLQERVIILLDQGRISPADLAPSMPPLPEGAILKGGDLPRVRV